MARRKKDGVEETVTQPETEVQDSMTIEQLLAENARLKEERETMQATLATMGDIGSIDRNSMKYMNEVAAIKRSGRVDAEKIKVKEFTDHKNISLWTKDGKRIGPLHRDNALSALNRFFSLGIMLSTKEPTKEEIAAWLASPEGKAWSAAETKKRDANYKTRKRGELEKILKIMGDQFGLNASALMSIKKLADVQTLEEGRKVLGS
jgi:hypothetical protein